MLDYTVLQLIQMGMYVPPEIRLYIISKYGLFTMRDFDKYFGLNDVLGKPYDNCYASIMSLSEPKAYYSCLSSEEKLLFNIVYSTIKSPLDIKVWL
tara:strand:+ start:1366 stop:1653 length:288 start_codon:yes stop_codon:yes gene_type:complete